MNNFLGIYLLIRHKSDINPILIKFFILKNLIQILEYLKEFFDLFKRFKEEKQQHEDNSFKATIKRLSDHEIEKEKNQKDNRINIIDDIILYTP